MWGRVVTLAGLLIGLAGCGDVLEVKSDPKEETTSEELCSFVSSSTLEEIFGARFDEGRPGGSGVPGQPWCDFRPRESAEQVDVNVLITREDVRTDPLDRYFEGETYEEVGGLGDAAGFVPKLSGGYDTLVVVTTVGEQHRFIAVSNLPVPEPDADQTRPVAEEVLAGLGL